MRHTKLDKIYKQESNPDVKERIQLVRHIVQDKQHIEDVAKELHRCRAWAYKWYKRYNYDGLDGLKDKERSGRPPDVPKEIMLKIRKELADNNTGWDFRQVMDLFTKSQELDIMKYISTVYYTNGVSSLKYQRKDLSILHR